MLKLEGNVVTSLILKFCTKGSKIKPMVILVVFSPTLKSLIIDFNG